VVRALTGLLLSICLLVGFSNGAQAATTDLGTIDGTVTDCQTNLAVAGASYDLFSMTTSSQTSGTADSSGQLSVSVVPDNYDVVVTAPAYTRVNTFVTVRSGHDVKVRPCINIDVPGSLSATLTDCKTGLPLAGADFAIGSQKFQFGGGGLTDSQGGFSFNNLPPTDDWELTLSDGGYRSYDKIIEIAAGQVITLKLCLHPEHVQSV
jgi:hypothetical protein